MSKRNFKLCVVPTGYILAILMFGTSMYLFGKIINNARFESPEDMEYVDKEIVTDNEYIPVVATENTIMKPFLIDGVVINKAFYNFEDSEENQEKSLIIYKDTYMQNTGTDYMYSEVFDIVSVLDGVVIEVSDNEILGKVVKIRHGNDLISSYSCLSDVSVKKDDSVLRGQVIGKSGTSSLYPNDNNLHFELVYEGVNINPEDSYNKTIDEL